LAAERRAWVMAKVREGDCVGTGVELASWARDSLRSISSWVAPRTPETFGQSHLGCVRNQLIAGGADGNPRLQSLGKIRPKSEFRAPKQCSVGALFRFRTLLECGDKLES
jgi:hypothetical protein